MRVSDQDANPVFLEVKITWQTIMTTSTKF